MFLTREGETVHKKPNPDDFVSLPCDSKLEKSFSVWVYKRKPALTPGVQYNNLMDGVDVIADEPFAREPTEDQIMWCLLRYKGDFAVVHAVYTICDFPF